MGDSTVQADNELVLRLVTRPEEFQALDGDWNELLERSRADSFFLTWEWVSTWISCFSDGCQLRVIEARRRSDGLLLGIAPLAIYVRRWVSLQAWKELAFVGRGLSPDHLDFVMRSGHEERVGRALLDQVLAMRLDWDLLHLEGLVPSSVIVPLLEDMVPRSGLHMDTVVCPYIRLRSDFTAWLGSLAKRRRYRIRRNQLSLEQAFPEQIRVRRVTGSEDFESALPTLAQLHQEVRRAKGTSNVFRSPPFVRFHRQLGLWLLRRGRLRLYLLEIAGIDVAAVYCFRYRERVLFYATGYDRGYADYSPGVYLLLHAIKESIAEHAEVFDFLRGDESYKFLYTDLRQEDLDIRVAPRTRGRWVLRAYRLGKDRVRPALRRLKAMRL